MNVDIDELEGGAVTVVNYGSQAALDSGLAASLNTIHSAGEVVVKATAKFNGVI